MNFEMVFWGDIHAKIWKSKLSDFGKIELKTEIVPCVVTRF